MDQLFDSPDQRGLGLILFFSLDKQMTTSRSASSDKSQAAEGVIIVDSGGGLETLISIGVRASCVRD